MTVVLETFWRRRGGPRSRFPLLLAEIKLLVMDNADIKNLAANVKTLTAGARSTGPRTEAGKVRSAINAVKHGLAGRNLLLPGENAQEYESKLDGIFASLAPQNGAEAELVALVADDIWKLGRLARIEKGITLGRIEELLGLTATAEKAVVTGNAIMALGKALAEWAAHPIPTEKGTGFRPRFDAMVGALDLVEATVAGIPAGIIDTCDYLLAELHGKRGETEVPQGTYLALFDAARELMTLLLDRGQAEEVTQEELRASISGIALPNKEELAKLAKYRTMLETSLQRRLTALEQLRKLGAASTATEADQVKAREFRVKLRVVT